MSATEATRRQLQERLAALEAELRARIKAASLSTNPL